MACDIQHQDAHAKFNGNRSTVPDVARKDRHTKNAHSDMLVTEQSCDRETNLNVSFYMLCCDTNKRFHKGMLP